ATQSGPLLVYSGVINRNFSRGSDNRFVRNGVGIFRENDTDLVIFAISNRPVNFYDFAHFFRDFLHCSDALYLDGHISAMFLPSLQRNRRRGSFGTIIYSRQP
ncbi:MAG: phosphodiester glycosidase family protein, partial [Spirochaetaceae bacterium]|nr:phosphodiester glycosidase family protein [Spirochaetaceae bacterium]